MKPLKIALIFISLLLGYVSSFAQTKIMSYNIRYDSQNDGENRWDLRKDELVKLLEYYHPDLLVYKRRCPTNLNLLLNILIIIIMSVMGEMVWIRIVKRRQSFMISPSMNY